MMKKVIYFLLIGLWVSFNGMAYSKEIKDDSILPDLILTAPQSEQQISYLGLSVKPGEQFNISDIDADILIIELFSMYCPYCQKEAPLVNEFYALTAEKTGGVTVKMIGLGASNSQFEVEHFASTYGVGFPLFPDKDMSMYKALGGKGTPGFVGFKLKNSNPPVNVLRNSGGFYKAEDFLKDIISNSGL